MWLGALGLMAMLCGGAAACKAQEVNPAIFTDGGVEDAYPAKKATPRKTVKTQNAATVHHLTARTAVQRRKARHPARSARR